MSGIEFVIFATLLATVAALLRVIISREVGRTWPETVESGVRVVRHVLNLCAMVMIIYAGPDVVHLIQRGV
ncbi:hypothetical protein ABZX77_03470 [Streptomyces sp. NPDC004237]|uniref:hypothetical protein n=1 Tax=Streptomyces sp. NPDC004237 TaxID=3154455 RepID=UPI0033A975E0